MSPRIAALALAAVAFSGCTCSRKTSPPDPAAAAASSAAPPPTSGPERSRATTIDAIEHLEACMLGHRGVLLDMGDATTRAPRAPQLEGSDLETVEHEGATWSRVRSRALALTFHWAGDTRAERAAGEPAPPRRPAPPPPASGGRAPRPAPDAGDALYVMGRVRNVLAKSISVYLNGKVVGAWAIDKGDLKVVTARGSAAPLVPGTNELLLRFNGVPKSNDDVAAEIDWIHVGLGDPPESYTAPTRADALVSGSLGGVSKRAISLRAPGFVRCLGWVPAGGTAEASVGLVGTGDADVEIRLLRDRSPPAVLGSAHVVGGEPWTKLSVPVGDVGATGALGALELTAIRATKGSRVLFGEPRVIAAAPPSPREEADGGAAARARARSAVVVVLGGMATRTLAPYGGARPVPELSALAAAGTVFEAHRASTAFGHGAMASMLTGLSARAHGVEDGDARLPKGLTTIADAARQSGLATAMFTANPYTAATFGFERGWDTFTAHAPNEDTPGTQVFDEAAAWLEKQKDRRFLLVVHARGGHPPWDVSVEQLKTLPPPNYTGGVDPRRAGEVLGKSKRFPNRFNDADRTRVWASYAIAVDAHDAALGKLLTALRSAGHEEDTAVVVTGDASVNEAAPVPFVEGDALDEAQLTIPMVLRVPGEPGGRRVKAPTGSADVARTLTEVLGLEAPASFGGTELLGLARGDRPHAERPMAATAANRFSVRWGPFVLIGTRDKAQHLCDLVLEPSCVTDVRATHPLAMTALHRVAFDAAGPGAVAAAPREPVFLDPTTLAQLTAWGRPPDRKKRGRDRDRDD